MAVPCPRWRITRDLEGKPKSAVPVPLPNLVGFKPGSKMSGNNLRGAVLSEHHLSTMLLRCLNDLCLPSCFIYGRPIEVTCSREVALTILTLYCWHK